jgi:hypothetical protein
MTIRRGEDDPHIIRPAIVGIARYRGVKSNLRGTKPRRDGQGED